MNRQWYVWCVILALATGAVSRAESLRIVPIARDNEVLVSFVLADAYNNDVREIIASGLRTTFTYTLELRTAVPLWVDRTIASAVVSVTDQFDNLTGRHSLARRVDGRVVEEMVTEDEEVVRLWLTRWDRLALCETSKLQPHREYYVRVSARVRPHADSLLGWGRWTRGQAPFTFIP